MTIGEADKRCGATERANEEPILPMRPVRFMSLMISGSFFYA